MTSSLSTLSLSSTNNSNTTTNTGHSSGGRKPSLSMDQDDLVKLMRSVVMSALKQANQYERLTKAQPKSGTFNRFGNDQNRNFAQNNSYKNNNFGRNNGHNHNRNRGSGNQNSSQGASVQASSGSGGAQQL